MRRIRKTKRVREAVNHGLHHLAAILQEVQTEDCMQEFDVDDVTGENGCNCDKCDREDMLSLAIMWIEQKLKQ